MKRPAETTAAETTDDEMTAAETTNDGTFWRDASATAAARVWENPDDDAYAALLEN